MGMFEASKREDSMALVAAEQPSLLYNPPPGAMHVVMYQRQHAHLVCWSTWVELTRPGAMSCGGGSELKLRRPSLRRPLIARKSERSPSSLVPPTLGLIIIES
jgi:hypothetical protein